MLDIAIKKYDVQIFREVLLNFRDKKHLLDAQWLHPYINIGLVLSGNKPSPVPILTQTHGNNQLIHDSFQYPR